MLCIKKIKDIEGEASIAVVRGEPRTGYELTFKAELEGVEGTYLEGMTCEIEINELCDDSAEPDGFSFEVKSCLDTEQGTQSKLCVGYKNNCNVFCEVIRQALKEYPYKMNNC